MNEGVPPLGADIEVTKGAWSGAVFGGNLQSCSECCACSPAVGVLWGTVDAEGTAEENEELGLS